MTRYKSIMRSDWLGLDFSEAEPIACFARKGIFGGISFGEADPAKIALARPDGARCAVAAPTDKIFTEKIVVEGVSKRRATDFVVGKLDISLPVPVEECITEATEIKGGPSPAFTAYALPIAAYNACRDEVSKNLGFTVEGAAPEAIVPAAAAVWEFLNHSRIGAQAARRPRIHISAAARQWFVAAGRSAIEIVVSIPVGDTAALLRNIAIISTRLESPLITASGSGADNKLADALAQGGHKLAVVDSPVDFLARAIAYYGSRTHSGIAVNFNCGDNTHPATVRDECAEAFFAVFWLVLLGALFLAGAIHDHLEQSFFLGEADSELSAAADHIAGRHIEAEPLVAIELAKNESAKQLNQDVEAFTKQDATGAIAAACRFASEHAILFTRMSVEDDVLTVESEKLDAAKIREFGISLAGEGHKLEVIADNGFKANIKPAGGDANE